MVLNRVNHANNYNVLWYCGVLYFYDVHRHHIPHFHVEYAEFTAVVAIESGDILEGDLPRNKMKLVQAWLEIHRE